LTAELNEKYVDLHFLCNNMWQLQSITGRNRKLCGSSVFRNVDKLAGLIERNVKFVENVTRMELWDHVQIQISVSKLVFSSLVKGRRSLELLILLRSIERHDFNQYTNNLHENFKTMLQLK
ncbi:unnamed protein product, partial [Heterotrigona itama]